MNYRFEDFELDEARFELRRGGAVLATEPQVLSLLLLLVRHRDRLVDKDEINAVVWEGRFVSDSALASRVKSLRRLLDDDGRQQRLVRTVHGRGFRFCGTVTEAGPARATEAQAPVETVQAVIARPSIAVLPFARPGAGDANAAIADALPHDLITELSRLRWLFVIARGSSFRFRSDDADIREVGRQLGVKYCLSGSVEIAGDRMQLAAELADTGHGGVVWSERYMARLDEVHAIRESILGSIVAALELQIPLAEAQQARLKSPESLDAWATYHLGLDHMFRFTREDNAVAERLFARAAELEPGFARAVAGLSFTRFQNAFLHYTGDTAEQALAARRLAEEAVALDARDPFANLVMGRSHWLSRDLDGSFPWLERATQLSPNYAQGIYARAWAETLSGRGEEGQRHSDLAMSLSPLDPLHYAMMATRALSHIAREEDAEAAAWAERAARSPGAHVLIHVIAAGAHELAGNPERAAHWAGRIRAANPSIGQAAFFQSFPMTEGRLPARIAAALQRHGI